MDVKVQVSKILSDQRIEISGSKSESNRLLLLQALYPEIELKNISDSDDSEVMIKALSASNEMIDIGHAGTTMRFLTAYFSISETRSVSLTGSARMKQRPIKILVDALRQLGAEIEYLETTGFPPIRITGKRLTKNKVTIDPGVSSQYISALLLIAPKLENGLEIILAGKPTSVPYLDMTLSILKRIGIKTSFENNLIKVLPFTPDPIPITKNPITIESDWSSASYFYSIIALSDIGTRISLSTYNKNSLQGDSALAAIYISFGVETSFEENYVTLTKVNYPKPQTQNFQLNNTPDLAQTIAVTCFGLGIGCRISGLQTLKIKETDRLEALQSELTKLGAEVSITNDSISVAPSAVINDGIFIKTYGDHRMAMAFAPLALKVSVIIEDGGVVSKSYPEFWNDLKKIGFNF